MKKQSQTGSEAVLEAKGLDPQAGQPPSSEPEYLRLLGDCIRAARARRSMTRKMLATHSGVSERFLAQLESGTGNASILVLRQIANALSMPIDAILPNGDGRSSELAYTTEFLRRLDPASLARARDVLLHEFGHRDSSARRSRIALIGLRGAGKSTIGKLLAKQMQLHFFELDRLIEQTSGISLSMIFDLYGQSGFRRFERRCLEDLLKQHETFVVATGGSLVSEPATYNRLLNACHTIWLRATPEEHMSRVIAQGDMRPMAHNPEAMSDLERILAEREHLYRKADVTIDTSARSIDQVLGACMQNVNQVAAQA